MLNIKHLNDNSSLIKLFRIGSVTGPRSLYSTDADDIGPVTRPIRKHKINNIINVIFILTL